MLPCKNWVDLRIRVGKSEDDRPFCHRSDICFAQDIRNTYPDEDIGALYSFRESSREISRVALIDEPLPHLIRCLTVLVDDTVLVEADDVLCPCKD